MSSILTKTILAGISSKIASKSSIEDFSMDSFDSTVSSPVFVATYGAMCAYDIYDFFKGDIRNVTTQDSEGNIVSKEYRVQTLDYVKLLTNTLPVLGQYISYDFAVYTVWGIIIETATDAFNRDLTTTFADEINGDHSFEL